WREIVLYERSDDTGNHTDHNQQQTQIKASLFGSFIRRSQMIVTGDYNYQDKEKREQLKLQGEEYVKKESESDIERDRKTNWRHFFIICSILISAYLINGEHAQTVCNICTTVPAAIFTYIQLSDHATRIFAYVTKNLREQQQQQQQHQYHRKVMSNSIISTTTPTDFTSSYYGSQFGIDTAISITDATQISTQNLFGSHPSLYYNNNLITAYSFARSPEMTAYLDTSYTHDGSLKTISSTEEKYKVGEYKRRQTAALNDSLVLSDSGEENYRSENDRVKSIPAVGSLNSSEYSPSAMMKKENEETLVTNPDEYIVFKHPFSEMVTIYVKNKHSRPIMWALKTNAIKRLIAQPTCGTLGKDATVHIKIGVTAMPSEESNMNDRVAIDYCLIDDDTIGFDRSFLYNAEDPFRRRKKFNIYYKN
uniref:Major sperm protein n=1 Tax=Elaeophora elaphi TaxID=1147741 RepID=A0A0R3S6F6_9BILA